MFTVSLKKKKKKDQIFSSFCSSTRTISPSRRLLRRSHPRSPATSFCLFQMWCQIFTEADPEIDFPGSTLGSTRRIRRQIYNCCVCQNLTPMNGRVEFSQRMHFLYRSFYVNMKNQHFFLLISLLPGVFVQNDTFLFVHQSACFMNVLQWTVFVSLLENKQKKLPKDIESQAKAKSNWI